MEALYSKLYDKYTKLKKKKLSDLEHLNKDQEVKFLNYISAAEELIQHLKNENDKLHAEVNELRSEVASIRLSKDDQVAEYQRLSMEETKKHEILAEKFEKFRKPQEGGVSGSLEYSIDGISVQDQLLKSTTNNSSRRMTRKRDRKEASTPSPLHGKGQNNSVLRNSAKNLQEIVSSKAFVNIDQPESCMKAVDHSGDNVKGTTGDCLIQSLFEYTVGVRLSSVDKTGHLSVLAQHLSSGYSFSLTCVKKKGSGDEADLIYHVLSLGTFERVAPEWMREDIIFSATMCPIFFERINRVIKLHN